VFAATRDLGPHVTELLATEGALLGSQVVIPASVDGVAPDDLARLRAAAGTLQRFEAIPQAVLARHVEAAYHTALRLELAQIAIPVHIQNLKDHVARKHGLPNIADGMAKKLVSGWSNALELRDDTYHARRRLSDAQASRLMPHWRDLLDSSRWAGIFDLPAYIEWLSDWYAPILDGGVDSPAIVLERGPHVRLLGVAGRAGCELSELVESPKALMEPFLSLVDDGLEGELEAQYRLRARLLSGDSEDPASLLFDMACLWMQYVDRPAVRGQEQKWRGWYLLPEHGPLTPAKLQELAAVLGACERIASRGAVTVDRSPVGVANANTLLALGGVTYRTDYSPMAKRDLFIRQQRNYLVRLGLLNERAANVLELTDRGILWGAAVTDAELADLLEAALGQLRWTWCNMQFFGFTQALAAAADGYVTYAELFSWVIHALAYSQLEEMTAALKTYRRMTAIRQERLFFRICGELESRLARGGGVGAMGHYRTKIRDMMTAFETTGVFRVEGTGPRARLALRRR
jgi:hypothetical protein